MAQGLASAIGCKPLCFLAFRSAEGMGLYRGPWRNCPPTRGFGRKFRFSLFLPSAGRSRFATAIEHCFQHTFSTVACYTDRAPDIRRLGPPFAAKPLAFPRYTWAG